MILNFSPQPCNLSHECDSSSRRRCQADSTWRGGETASQDASSHHHDCRNDADENGVMKLSSVFSFYTSFQWFWLVLPQTQSFQHPWDQNRADEHFLSGSDTTELFIGMWFLLTDELGRMGMFTLLQKSKWFLALLPWLPNIKNILFYRL